MCGDSRHDLNYPEIPNSWNNKEIAYANFKKEKTKMTNFNEKINCGTGHVLSDRDYFIYRSDSTRIFERLIDSDLLFRKNSYRLCIQYKDTHPVESIAGHCFRWECASNTMGSYDVRNLCLDSDGNEDLDNFGDPVFDSIEGAIFITDKYVVTYGDSLIEAGEIRGEHVVCNAYVCGRFVSKFRIPAEVFDRQFGLNENFPEQYAKPVKVETKNKCEQAVELIAVDLINEAKRNIESFKNLLDTNECQLERAMDSIKEALMDIDDQKCDLIDMLAKLDDTIRKLK